MARYPSTQAYCVDSNGRSYNAKQYRKRLLEDMAALEQEVSDMIDRMGELQVEYSVGEIPDEPECRAEMERIFEAFKIKNARISAIEIELSNL